MPPALPLLRVVGPSKSGKTRVAERLVADLVGRGFRVAAAKHSDHATPVDTPGADSTRLGAAGAAEVVLAGSDGMLARMPGGAGLGELLGRLTGHADVLVVEGYKDATLGPAVTVDLGARSATLSDVEGAATVAPLDDVSPLVEAFLARFHLSADGDERLRTALREAAAFHGHLCPGQVLGVRMALAGLDALRVPADPHRLHVTVEIDRCATDAIMAVTHCTPGKRALRILDFGKMAATFVDTRSGGAVRVLAREDARTRAAEWAPSGLAPRHQQAVAYRRMPLDALLEVTWVTATAPDRERPPRQVCASCGETVNFGRVERCGEAVLCRPCAGYEAYYTAPSCPPTLRATREERR